MQAVLSSINNPTPVDYFVQYTAKAALAANLSVWQPAHLRGDLATEWPSTKPLLDAILAQDKKAAEVVPYLQTLLGKEPQPEEQRNKAIQAITDLSGGNADNGKTVFRRSCIACHKVYGEGADFGPDMMKVGTRLTPFKIVQSIIDPNAEIDAKYLSTLVLTDDGTVITGLLVSDTKEQVVIFDGKQKRTIPTDEIQERRQVKQSSMPEGLAATLSPTEFLDVIALLKSLK